MDILKAIARRILSGELDRLHAEIDRAQYEALTDRLTGLWNRRALEHLGAMQAAEARRYNRDLAVAFVDLDEFGAINKRHGHESGDAVLRAVARILASTARDADEVFRYGGDEFVVLMPETSEAAAETAMRRIEAAVRYDTEIEMTWAVAAYRGETDDVGASTILPAVERADHKTIRETEE